MGSSQKASLHAMPLFGVAGWSNSGKTTLIEKLTRHLSGLGLRVATIKHTHHKFDIDKPDSDTARHRRAGAAETAIVSGSRVAIIEEIEALRFNTAIAKLMELCNALTPLDAKPRSSVEALLLMLAPFAPHMAEELWSLLGHEASIAYAPWPSYATDLVDLTTNAAIQNVYVRSVP